MFAKSLAPGSSAQRREWVLWWGCILFLLVAYAPVVPDLLHDYQVDQNAQHGILAVPISIWLVWRQRDSLRGLKAGSEKGSGLALILLGMTVFLLSYIGNVAVLSRASLVPLLLGIVLFTLGRDYGRKLWFPILFTGFLVPVPDFIIADVAFPLQLFASSVSAWLLNSLGIVTETDGNVLSVFTPEMLAKPWIPAMKLEVVAACSGIRSIAAYSMLSVLFAYLNRSRWSVAVLLIFLAIPIALAANILRVTSSGILAYHFGVQAAEGFLHDSSGMVLFLLGFVVFLCLSGLLSRLWPSGSSREESPKADGSPLVCSLPSRLPTRIALLLMVVFAGLVHATILRPRVVIARTNLEGTPLFIGEWVGEVTHIPNEDRINRILQVDVTTYRSYRRGEDGVALYVGFYGTEKGGRSSHNPRSCYVGGGWDILEDDTLELRPAGREKPVVVNHMLVQLGEYRQQVLHWYQVKRNRVVPSGIGLNLYRFLRSVLENRNDGAFVRVTSDIPPGRTDVQVPLGLVQEFSEQIIPVLAEHWPLEMEAGKAAAMPPGESRGSGTEAR